MPTPIIKIVQKQALKMRQGNLDKGNRNLNTKGDVKDCGCLKPVAYHPYFVKIAACCQQTPTLTHTLRQGL